MLQVQPGDVSPPSPPSPPLPAVPADSAWQALSLKLLRDLQLLRQL